MSFQKFSGIQKGKIKILIRKVPFQAIHASMQI
jgi:hypothetical protein